MPAPGEMDVSVFIWECLFDATANIWAENLFQLTRAVPEQFDFAKLVFLPNEAGNLRGSDVEADNDFFGVLRSGVVHHG